MNEHEPPPQLVWAYHVTLDSGKLISWAYHGEDSAPKSQLLLEVAEAMEQGAACLRELAAGGHRGAMLDRMAMALKLSERGISFEEFRQKIEEGPNG